MFQVDVVSRAGNTDRNFRGFADIGIGRLPRAYIDIHILLVEQLDGTERTKARRNLPEIIKRFCTIKKFMENCTVGTKSTR